MYYCFHWSFEKDFQRIAEQWCASKDVEFIGHYYALNDDAYPHVLTSKEAEPSPTHGSVIQSDDKRPEPLPQRRDDFKYSGDEELLVYQMSQSQPVPQQPQRLQPDSEQRYDAISGRSGSERRSTPTQQISHSTEAVPPQMGFPQTQIPGTLSQQTMSATQHIAMQQQQIQAQLQMIQAQLQQTNLQGPGQLLAQLQALLQLQQQLLPGQPRLGQQQRPELGDREAGEMQGEHGPKRRHWFSPMKK